MLLRLRWGLAGALVAFTLIRAFGLERGWPLVPLLAFAPHAALLAVVATGLAAWRRWWPGAAVIGLCAVVLVAVLVPRAVPDGTASAGAPGVRLRVLAANVGGNAAAGRDLLRDVRRWDVDVLSVIELSPRLAEAYDDAGVRSAFPQRVLRPLPGFSGTGLYARFPLRRLRAPEGTRFGMTAAEVLPPGAAPVELLSIHVPAPTGPGATADWRRDLRVLPAGGGPGPLRVLAGDFNATLDHAELRRLLARGYRDVAAHAGTGLRPTWPAGQALLPGLVAIDHVLADRRARIVSARSVPLFGSDHRGVLTELAVPRG